MTISSLRGEEDRSWAARGTCRDLDPDGFFVQGADQQRVKSLCHDCPVRMQCLADALDNRIEFGVWGGMTERERRRLLRQHPQVEDWFDVLRRSAERASS
ncbi:WhiB family transcriptional regulator [Brachybacterium sp. JHP9]|uniref:Transcriptional regulator WhiB n=1 Tax=Brachybacterium equifaecis TaxID=2910770 RepID=A0ABT0QXP9_9MICO|nr:WhiB family transcriptional regulator [Brachybacterium equifaecis]